MQNPCHDVRLNPDGNTVFKQGYYTYTDNGLEQSPVQYKLSRRLAKSVNSYIKKSGR